MVGSELPKGWKLTKLGNILCRMTNGLNIEQTDVCSIDSFPISRIETIANEKIDFSRVKYCTPSIDQKQKYLLEDGDILFSHINSDKHLGKTAIYKDIEPLIHGVNLLLLRCNSELYNSGMLNYLLRYYRYTGLFMGIAQRAVNQSSINQKKLSNLDIPLPPLTEQKQIAEKLDKLFDQIETIKEASNKIPELLKNFRQQVLTYAVTGKLTDSDYESWELKTLDEIAIPKAGYAFKATDFIDNGIQVIRMGNLYDNKLSLDRNPVFVPENYDTDIIERSRVKRNDILLTLTGTKYKRDYGYAIKIDTDEVLLLNQRILSLTPLIDPDYLLLVLRSDEFRNQFFEFETGGVNQGNVGVKNVMTIKLHIPSPRIQEEIVRRTKILFNILDNIERRYNILCEKLDKLPQALLGKAFNGELAL